MKIFYPALHAHHNPSKDYSDGFPPFDHLEKPVRVDLVLQGMQTSSTIETEAVEGQALEAVYALHDRDFVDFLLAVANKIDDDHEYMPSIFRESVQTSKTFIQGGMYCKELGTPIGSDSIEAALNSAATAITAAEYVCKQHDDAIALCRPPGHHAGRRRYGGYCFFNNAYLAARHLSANALCCPVLDIDYHLGDGSLEFAEDKIPYFSLHADPWDNYPYLEKNSDLSHKSIHLEILPDRVDGNQYCTILSKTVEQINQYNPDFMVLSLGFDALVSDKIQDIPLCLELPDYAQIGKLISTLKSPILMLLEGGYDFNNLEQCARNFIHGFNSGRN